jgi:hypothetical protein
MLPGAIVLYERSSRRIMKGCVGRSLLRSAAFGFVGLTLLSSMPVLAQTDDDAARRHFESGAEYLARSDYENALREFKAAYELSKRPELLLNIATVYEREPKTPSTP